MNSRWIRPTDPCLDCLRRCLARKNYRPASGSAGSDRFSVTGRGKSTVSIPTLMVLKPIFWRPWPKREQAPAQGIKRSLARFRPEADYQICLRRLELLEPVYRMQFGPAINNGWRTSLCSSASTLCPKLETSGPERRFSFQRTLRGLWAACLQSQALDRNAGDLFVQMPRRA